MVTFKFFVKDDWRSKTVTRAYNAHLNHFEALLGFSVAVFLALHAGLKSEIVNLCNWFIHVRVLYNVAYILAYNEPLSAIRSGLFTVGIVIMVRILMLSIAAGV